MKLVTKVTTAIAALAAVAMLASCGSTSGASSEASAPAAAPAASGSASVWEWKSVPLSDIGTNDTVIDDRFILDPASNPCDAEFAAVAGKAKFKTEDLGTAIYLQNKAASNKDNIKDVFQAAFEVVVKAPAKVTLTISGNGDATPARVFGVFDPSGAMIASVDNLGQDAKSELVFDAATAGAYTIKASGTRIYGVKVEAK
ncbi:hypothetical protein SAMN02745152_00528 [Treponema berlinense]|uniref:Lipoprotein n=1 Tax=Treponema berlinense TaxID=225004 RepID=A0A1T4LGN4_9SPIR|nr:MULTISPECIES: hypothetical protein [Treponema]MBQ9101613.1 hypothetical protein [Treponema sp.]MCI5540870.1 copper resistance protein CopC [Treponema berlinense]MDD5833639.1 hypothetical protein [Treponema berlinense]MDY3707141.1 hypothetical protein [Treponema berlinense]SJZ53919.1 hypothetical protein SAMN02745152_00528 [Treponema berlinense]